MPTDRTASHLSPKQDYATTLNKGHGRVERRECWGLPNPARLSYLPEGQPWPELKAAVKVISQRDTPAGTRVATRSYWRIANSRIRSRDATFRKVQRQVRKVHGDRTWRPGVKSSIICSSGKAH